MVQSASFLVSYGTALFQIRQDNIVKAKGLRDPSVYWQYLLSLPGFPPSVGWAKVNMQPRVLTQTLVKFRWMHHPELQW